jgi:hypothetical protein
MVMPGATAPSQTTVKAAAATPVTGNAATAVSTSQQTPGLVVPQSIRIAILLVFTYLVIGIALSLSKDGKGVRSIKKLFNIFFWPLRLLKVSFN